MIKDKNTQIENFIDGIGDRYDLTLSQLAFLVDYDKCYDNELSQKLVRMVWKSCFENIDMSDLMSSNLPAKCLIPFLGAGKLILEAPKSTSFWGFNQDYYCHFIAKSTTSGVLRNSFAKYDFGTLAEMFMVYEHKDLPIYDIVLCQPPKICKLATLDADTSMANIALNDARLYYFLRSTFFMKKGCVLIMFVEEKTAEQFMKKAENYMPRTNVRLEFDDYISDGDQKDGFAAIKYLAV